MNCLLFLHVRVELSVSWMFGSILIKPFACGVFFMVKFLTIECISSTGKWLFWLRFSPWICFAKFCLSQWSSIIWKLEVCWELIDLLTFYGVNTWFSKHKPQASTSTSLFHCSLVKNASLICVGYIYLPLSEASAWVCFHLCHLKEWKWKSFQGCTAPLNFSHAKIHVGKKSLHTPMLHYLMLVAFPVV